MAYAFMLGGLILLDAGVRGSQDELFKLLKKDIVDGHYLYWVVAIFAIGAIGYSEKLKPLSDAFLLLVILVLFLHNHGFFAEFMQEIQSKNGVVNV